VQIFENRGAMMGASNPHPHCQIWATESLPNEAVKELASQRAYREERGGCLLCDYLALELDAKARIVCENECFVALTPFWAVWPFETLVLPRRHFGAMDEMSAGEARGLADILRRLTIRYDNLFEISFPYSMGFHQSPTDGVAHPEQHFHAHFYPPLLRSASVRKFMVGFEMLGAPQRDITPESAAARMRDAPTVHYLERPASD
jgi:UDPglucose--hexose-1-phosphate uridylyltransferase